jgi:hypothetical protein
MKEDKGTRKESKEKRGAGGGGQKRLQTEESPLQVTIFEMLEAKKKKEK